MSAFAFSGVAYLPAVGLNDVRIRENRNCTPCTTTPVERLSGCDEFRAKGCAKQHESHIHLRMSDACGEVFI